MLIHVHMCVDACAFVCTFTWRLKVTPSYTLSHLKPELINSASLASQFAWTLGLQVGYCMPCAL